MTVIFVLGVAVGALLYNLRIEHILRKNSDDTDYFR